MTDVFEAFRRLCLNESGLEPVNFVGLPGFTWAAAFKYTGETIHLLQDREMYRFFESGIRGGMTFVNDHCVKRIPEQQEIFYVDAVSCQMRMIKEMNKYLLFQNNLYGHALSMPLPQKNFVWIEEQENLKDLLCRLPYMKWKKMKRGYVFEVDLEIPDHLHDLLDDLPLAPENRVVKDPTAFMLELWSLAEGRLGYRPTKKLLLTHLPKERYVVHFALLQFYLKMGAIVTKIHRAIKFDQAEFLEPYISFNSQKRQQAVTSFEKDYYKLKNNGESTAYNLLAHYLSIIFFCFSFPKLSRLWKNIGVRSQSN